jgi:adenylate cyclase
MDGYWRGLSNFVAGLSNYHAFRVTGGWFQWLAQLGTAGYPPEVRRRLMILNMIAYLIAGTTLIYAIQLSLNGFETRSAVVAINVGLVVVALLVPFANRISDISGALLISIGELVALVALTAYNGRASGTPLQYFVFAAAPFVVFGLQRIWLVLSVVATALILHIFAWFSFPEGKALLPPDPKVLDGLYLQAAITTMVLIAASTWYAFRLVEKAKAEADTLLRNILPDKIADRLKARPGELVADSHDEASVLFADVSGVVALTRSLGAEQVVELLNEIVSDFDALASRHGVEKIKTIGDAYMAVAGVPEAAPDHAERLTHLALDMLLAVERVSAGRGLTLRMRVGIASGQVMAGVIGTRKFSFDVWGDTVNLAARLENLSEPGRIHICPGCHQRLRNTFEMEPRGPIEIKGVGPLETWFIVALSGAIPPPAATAARI